jgi:hypothetical protein
VTGEINTNGLIMFDKSPLTPLCQRGEYKEISPFGKGGLRGFYKLYPSVA